MQSFETTAREQAARRGSRVPQSLKSRSEARALIQPAGQELMGGLDCVSSSVIAQVPVDGTHRGAPCKFVGRLLSLASSVSGKGPH